MTTRVTLEFEDDEEAKRFAETVGIEYIYESHDSRPLNGTATVVWVEVRE